MTRGIAHVNYRGPIPGQYKLKAYAVLSIPALESLSLILVDGRERGKAERGVAEIVRRD